uniref:Leucine-rich repeats and calponin homology (CH) domain containing 4 n=1 Tax=Takifugu rubripes TaxID=31033 RepID=H2RVB3_TAKRU
MAAGDGAQLPATVAASRSVEKALEEAAVSGALNLSNRRLKEFPRSARNYDLSDITHADLSKNRLCELPEELCQFMSLETLSLYHNGMRSLSPSLSNLQALTYLNLSRNLLSSLPPSVFQLPFLRVLIISNNKLCSLSTSIYALTHLRQLDVSCNELQSLPPELGQLECLRDLNLRRNHLTTLPEEISELPLVRLDISCNGISHVPLCYRHLRHLQSISLDNNPLQMPPAQICSKGKYHIFKYLNMEACKRNQEELERHLRPTGFSTCLTEQELFTGQIGLLDSGFNSVESGSKRWSGNESTDDFSERSLRMTEVSRDQMNLEEEQEEDGFSLKTGEPSFYVEEGPPSPSSSSSDDSSPLSPSSPTIDQRKKPGTLLIWQEREPALNCQLSVLLRLFNADENKDVLNTLPVLKTLESHLKITLPEDLGEALSNGTVLCQLVNHIRPRSVSIIHVPSPAVPKLSTAKSRVNVESFLGACRKLGLPEKAVCTCSDVLLSNLSPVLDCVTALLAVECEGVVGEKWSHSSSPSSSLLSLDFLLFYCAAMALLCVLYCYLLT